METKNGILMKSIGGFYYVRNMLKRPALANIDMLVIVCSTVDPLPNYTIIDKMTAIAFKNEMTPVIAVSKNDLQNGDEIARIYRNSGIEVFCCSPDETDEIDRLKQFLSKKISAFTGNSGVGKSTLCFLSSSLKRVL